MTADAVRDEDEAPALTVTVPHVLLLLDALSNNGAVQITVGLASRWSGNGAQLAVVRPPNGAALPTRDAVVEQLVPTDRRLRHRMAPVSRRLLALTRRSEVVLVGSEIGAALILGFLAAHLSRRPFVIAVHADLGEALVEWVPPSSHRLFRWLHRHADAAICVAPGLVPELQRNGLPADRITVVRNGIDTRAVTRAAGGDGSLVTGTVPVVVATGRLARQKGHDLLLRAHQRVVGQYPHRVLLLNDGPELEDLQALAAELGVQDSVVFAGAVPAPLPSVAQADLFCLPSRHEGLPLALLEAVTLGVPVVAADCSQGVRDALAGGAVGELVPVEDVAALARALEDHLRDPADLRARAAGGPAHARTFDVDVMAAGWAAALTDVVSRPRRRLWAETVRFRKRRRRT